MERMGENGGKKYYFIGIGGISMSALARYLLQRGNFVSGSDLVSGEQVCALREKGVEITVGEEVVGERLKEADVVVYTDAVSKRNRELLLAKEMGKKIYSRAELLQEISCGFSHVLSVAGSHGKTTCTSMCAHIFSASGAAFCAHIGGEDLRFGNFHYTGNEYFITEACEYKKNLLNIPSETAILLNVDKDHLDCYDGIEELKETFLKYCRAAKTAIVCLDDETASQVENAVSFSIYEKGANYRAVNLRRRKERYSFTVREYGVDVCKIRLRVAGRHNVYNALAAFAAARCYGFSVDEIKRGLESFSGVKRRFEQMGTYKGAEVVCDYAHHPKEILSAVQTALRMKKGKLYVVFQPHTYSRTKSLLDEFVEVLRGLDGLLIYKTFPAREEYDVEGDGKTLAERVGTCLYADNLSALRAWLNRTSVEGDLILFLGAGDIYYLAKYLITQPR